MAKEGLEISKEQVELSFGQNKEIAIPSKEKEWIRIKVLSPYNLDDDEKFNENCWYVEGRWIKRDAKKKKTLDKEIPFLIPFLFLFHFFLHYFLQNAARKTLLH